MKNHYCVSCKKEIPDGTKFQLCQNCFSELEIINDNCCKKCGEKTNASANACDYCKDMDYNFDSNKSFCYYENSALSIVKGLKYSSYKYYAKHIAELMFENKDYFDNVDIITFVPITNKRKRERGFNQAEEIAKHLSNLTGITVYNLLSKKKGSKHQAGLKRVDRLKNLKDSFEISKDFSGIVKDKSILIIDDVFTTGATLNECAKSIKKLKPKQIKTYTFAKTKLEN